ncbi:reactive intermediate/imine deaminase [beta proteobacterium AAP99]|nr:reactive intermediate/imine deaminase [beta proteobacterium AAP99]
MPKTLISSTDAPAAVGPYSQGVRAGNLVFLSGQVGLIPGTKNLAEGFEGQVRQAFGNMLALVKAAGAEPTQLVKLTLFVTDISKFGIVNQIMGELIPQPYPARSTVGVATLPLGAEFEVEAIITLD